MKKKAALKALTLAERTARLEIQVRKLELQIERLQRESRVNHDNWMSGPMRVGAK